MPVFLSELGETFCNHGNSGSSLTVSTTTGNTWAITLNAATVTVTLAGSGLPSAESLTLYLTQDSTGGRTVSWPAVTWLSGSAPYIAPGAGALTVVELQTTDGGTTWYGTGQGPALPLAVGNGGTGTSSPGAAGQIAVSQGSALPVSWQGLLPQAAVVTSAASPYSASATTLIPVDATGGSVTVNLPAGPFAGALAAVKMIQVTGSATTTVSAAAPDVIGRVTGQTSGSGAAALTLSLQGQGTLLSYSPPGTAWPLTANGSASTSLVLSGTGFAQLPVAAGNVAFLSVAAGSALSVSTPYYVTSATLNSPTSGKVTIQLSATPGGTAISSTVLSGALVAICGQWTVLSDDLPLSQLDLRYAALAGATLTGYLAPAVAALTFVASGTTLVSAAAGNVFSLALTASTTTLGTPSGGTDGQAIRIRVAQPSSGGPYTLAGYGTGYDFGAAGQPVLSTGASKVDVLGFEYNASLSKWCFLGAALGM